MANLKETRNRIVSVKSTMQITSAMKMVSAAKLKRAQDAITTMRPYAQKLTEILSNLSGDTSADNGSEYSVQREVKKVLLVPITSNRGLCGGFNASIVKKVVQLVDKNLQGKDISFYCIGKKGGDGLRVRGFQVAKSNIEILNEVTFQNVVEIAEELMDMFTSGKVDQIYFVYNQFINAASQEVQFEQFLPIEPSAEEGESSNVDYSYEPNKDEIVLDLIPKALKTQLFKAILDSVASEHGARMTAMHQATDNASGLVNDLLLEYNKARQAAITTEILEIVGGAEALAG